MTGKECLQELKTAISMASNAKRRLREYQKVAKEHKEETGNMTPEEMAVSKKRAGAEMELQQFIIVRLKEQVKWIKKRKYFTGDVVKLNRILDKAENNLPPAPFDLIVQGIHEDDGLFSLSMHAQLIYFLRFKRFLTRLKNKPIRMKGSTGGFESMAREAESLWGEHSNYIRQNAQYLDELEKLLNGNIRREGGSFFKNLPPADKNSSGLVDALKGLDKAVTRMEKEMRDGVPSGKKDTPGHLKVLERDKARINGLDVDLKKFELEIKKNLLFAREWQMKAETALENKNQRIAEQALKCKKAYLDSARVIKQEWERLSAQRSALKKRLSERVEVLAGKV